MVKKTIQIDDIEFKISVNRTILKQAFLEVKGLEELTRNLSNDSNLENKTYFEILDIQENMSKTMDAFTRFALPKMLELAEQPLCGFDTYEDYAKHIIEIAIFNDVYELYEDENGEVQKGFMYGIFEYGMSVFTQGKPKKARSRLVM